MKVFRLAAVGTDKARLKFRAIAMQARGTEVGPSLLGTAAIDNMNIDSMNSEPAALVESDRRSSFDLGANPGSTNTAAAMKAEIAMAESALII